MTDSQGDIEYARIQLEEARRRVESVEERITQVEIETSIGYIDKSENNPDISSAKIYTDLDNVEGDSKEKVHLQNKTEFTEMEGHVQNMIIDCQLSIEMAVKGMFKVASEQFDYSHGISFESGNTKNFYHNLPSGFNKDEEIVRAIFLTQFWERFYELAKYGAPDINVGPGTIFNESDAERALNDAKFCVDLAEDLIDHVDTNK